MKYEEEKVAVALYKKLRHEARKRNKNITVSVHGKGVHWNCDATLGERSCTIACFWGNHGLLNGAEYLSDYKHHETTMTMGRTQSDRDTISAILEWLHMGSVETLYQQFDFIDTTKRTLLSVEQILIQACPAIEAHTERELKHLGCDLYHLNIRAKDRGVTWSYYGKNTTPDIDFVWDDCFLFRLHTNDFAAVAVVIQRWLCEYRKPSELEAEFPWVQTGRLAQYYEHDQRVLGEFLLSWDGIEQFYHALHHPALPEILAFIQVLRTQGYDQVFRAGQSLWSLILSRSRRHGLRLEQPGICFWFLEQGMDVHINLDERRTLNFPTIAFTPEINDLLIQLKAKAID